MEGIFSSYKERLEKAAFEAREVTLDFQNLGLKMQGYNQHISFLGAYWRGMMQIGQGAVNPRTAKKMAAALIATQTLPAVLAEGVIEVIVLNVFKPNTVALAAGPVITSV